jgi:hypothetical protein
MKKITFLFVLLLLAGSLFSQKSVRLYYTIADPYIDGFIEDIWENSTINKIDVPFQSEVPTIGNSTWQGLYDQNYFYCIVYVEDDNHWPGWESEGNSWEYDKPEFYFDVNRELKDGVGTSASNTGHYQFAPGFTEGSYDMKLTTTAVAGNLNPGGTYAYSLIGEGYVYEIAIPWANMPDKNGYDSAFYNGQYRGNGGIGFDVTIIDQDEGITTSRQRMNWNNAGAIDECWNNMDDAGKIIMSNEEDFGPYLMLSSENMMLSSAEGSSDSITIDIESEDHTWIAQSDQSWLTVSPETHKGDGSLTVTASENLGARRTATVNFKWTCGPSGTSGTCYYNYRNLKVTQIAAIETGLISEKVSTIAITPNPVTTQFTIQGGIDRVELFNNLGELVKETAIKGRTISVSELPKGVYILKAYQQDKFAGVAKIVKK